MKQNISREELQQRYNELTEQASAIKKVLDMFPIQNNGVKSYPVEKSTPHESLNFKKGQPREVDGNFVPTVKDIIRKHGKPMSTDEIFNELVSMDYKFRTSDQPRKGAGIALGNAYRKGYLKRERTPDNEWIYRIA